MKDHFRFSCSGTITRIWISDSGKYCQFTLSGEVGKEDDKKTRRVEFQAFSDAIPGLRNAKPGDRVTVTGDIEMNPLKDKTKTEVKVDGFTKWTHALTAREVKGGTAAKAKAPPPPHDDSEDGQIPF